MLTPHYRPGFATAPLLLGKHTEIRLANGEHHRAILAIVDLGDLLASHHEQTFVPTAGFPTHAGENANDRNYYRDHSAQANTRNTAQHLDAVVLINDSKSPKGTPIITPDGIVVSGNGRTMALKLAVTEFPENYAAYVEKLRVDGQEFGFSSWALGYAVRGEEFKRPTNDLNKEFYPEGSPERIKFVHPVLVRIDLDFGAVYSPAQFAKFNQQTGKAEAPLDRSVKLANQLKANDGCRVQFTDLLGSFETFSELYDQPTQVLRLRNLLLECGVLNPNDLAALFTEHNQLTTQGKELVQQAAAGLLLGRPALEAADREGVQQFRQHITTSLTVLLKNEQLKPFSLIADLNAAVLAQRYLVASNNYSGSSATEEAFRAAFGTSTMFGQSAGDEAPVYSRQVLFLNRLLSLGRAAFKGAVEAINTTGENAAGENLFGNNVTPAEAFEQYVVKPVKTKLPATARFIDEYVATHQPAPAPSVAVAAATPAATMPAEQAVAVVEQVPEWPFMPLFQRTALALIQADGDVGSLTPTMCRSIVSELSGRHVPAGQSVVAELEQALCDRIGVVPAISPQLRKQQYQQWIDKGVDVLMSHPLTSKILVDLPARIKARISATKQVQPASAPAPQQSPGAVEVAPELAGPYEPAPAPATAPAPVAPLRLAAGQLRPSEPVARDWEKELTGGTFYRSHPDHVLGEQVQVSARFTDKVTVVRGTLADALARIPYELPTFEAVAETVVAPSVEMLAAADPKAVARAVKAGKRDLVNREIAKTAGAKAGDPTAKVVSFKEALKSLNPKVSAAEMECFLWHKYLDGDTWRGEWSGLASWGAHGMVTPHEAVLNQWIMSGICCYDGTRYHYAPLFYSGLAASKERTLRGNHIAIVAKIGEKAAQHQLDELHRRRPAPFTLTDPIVANRLQLRASAKFAREFTIAGLRDQEDYVAVKYSKPQGHRGLPQAEGMVMQAKPLPTAFSEWMLTLSVTEFTEGVNASDVIELYVLDHLPKDEKDDTPEKKAEKLRLMARARKAGERMFARFLHEHLRPFDQRRLEDTWNDTLNDFIAVDLDKIPVAFRYARTLKGEPLEVRPEKREQVAYMAAEGSGICAYDVGVGKTYAAIFCLAQALDSGQARRPLLVVPNQVYRQFVNEIKALLPHVPINEFYNLGTDINGLATVDGAGKVARRVEAGSITVITKEGLERIGFNDETQHETLEVFFKVLNQGNMSNREQGSLRGRLATLVGRGLKDTLFNIEDFDFDYLCHDEAHAAKKVFAEVRGETQGDGERERHGYQIQSGRPSSYGLRFFMLAQYVRRRNKGRNVLLLTATPFTNSPLEVYSMLALVAYDKLAAQGVANLKSFFDTYVKVSEELVITPSLKPAYKQVVMGFSNLASMQALIRRYINYKSADDVGAPRPDKIVLPLLNRREGEILVPLGVDERIETRLQLSPEQQMYMDDIEAYINGDRELSHICHAPSTQMGDAEAGDEEAPTGSAVEFSERALTADEKKSVRILRGINYARNIALSPYLYPCANLGLPTPQQYVDSSPKLSYVMGCIKAVRSYYTKRKEAVPGQIIYMDRGVAFFPQLRDYLIYQLGYRPEEIGMIYSGLTAERKDSVKNKFLGIRRNPQTGLEEPIADAERIKVLIGSSAIKEGMNLQRLGGYLYNCWVDWNPTDVKQLEGRIWRYGNQYAACAIVTPLMENSVEPFIMQKLQEKTSRINEIWSKPGRLNDLKLEEMNPAELKNALITDPEKVAGNIINDQVQELENQAKFYRNRADEVTQYVHHKTGYEKLLPEFREYMTTLTPEELFAPEPEVEPYPGQLPEERTKPKVHRIPDWQTVKYETLRDYYTNALYRVKRLRRPFKNAESLQRHAGWFGYLKRRVVEDNKLTDEQVDWFHNSLVEKVQEFEAQAKAVAAPERLAELTQQITAERAAQAYNRRTVTERVEEFTRVFPRIFLKRQAAAAPVIAPPPTPLQVAVRTLNAAVTGGSQLPPAVAPVATAAPVATPHPYAGRKGAWFKKGDQVQMGPVGSFALLEGADPHPAHVDAGKAGTVTSLSEMKRKVRSTGKASDDYVTGHYLNVTYADGTRNQYPVPQEAVWPAGLLGTVTPATVAAGDRRIGGNGLLSDHVLGQLKQIGPRLNSGLSNARHAGLCRRIVAEITQEPSAAKKASYVDAMRALYRYANIRHEAGKLVEREQAYGQWLATQPRPASTVYVPPMWGPLGTHYGPLSVASVALLKKTGDDLTSLYATDKKQVRRELLAELRGREVKLSEATAINLRWALLKLAGIDYGDGKGFEKDWWQLREAYHAWLFRTTATPEPPVTQAEATNAIRDIKPGTDTGARWLFGPLSRRSVLLLKQAGGFLVERLAGDRNRETRRAILSELTGHKMSIAQSGITALETALYKLAGVPITGLSGYEQTERYEAWLNAGLAAMQPTTSPAPMPAPVLLPAVPSTAPKIGFFRVGQSVHLDKQTGPVVVITQARYGSHGRPEYMYEVAPGDERDWAYEHRFYTVEGAAAPEPAGVEQQPATCPPRGADGVPLVDAASLQLLGMCLSMLPQTKSLHVDSMGNYTPERLAVHRRIIDKYTRNRPCRAEKPVAVLTGGLPGSGKSHLIKNSPFAWVNDAQKVIHVDADAIRAELPEYQGWNAAQTHAETKDLVKHILDHIGEPCSHDIVYDGTMNKVSSYLPLIAQLKELGYEVFIMFVKVSLETSTKRVLDRYQRTGRYVPLEIVEEAYHAGDAAFKEIRQQVNGYLVYDGLTGELLEKGGEAIPTTRQAPPEGERYPTVELPQYIDGQLVYHITSQGLPVVVTGESEEEADYSQVAPCLSAQYYTSQAQAVCAALHASYRLKGKPFHVYHDPKRQHLASYQYGPNKLPVTHEQAGNWFADGGPVLDGVEPGDKVLACQFQVGHGTANKVRLLVLPAEKLAEVTTQAPAVPAAPSRQSDDDDDLAFAQAQRIRILKLRLRLKKKSVPTPA